MSGNYYKKLTPEEEMIIVNGGTEPPFHNEYYNHFEKGMYVCRRCDQPLFRSDDKFHSDCGWPSFDDEIPGSVIKIPDKDGVRTEIRCSRCGAHLGHIFYGEGYTFKNRRYCVNSLSILFIRDKHD